MDKVFSIQKQTALKLKLISVLRWRTMFERFKLAVEIGNVVKTTLLGNNGNGQFRVFNNEFTGVFDAYFDQKLKKGLVRPFFKVSTKCIFAHIGLFCYFVQRDGFMIAFHYIIINLAHSLSLIIRKIFTINKGRERGGFGSVDLIDDHQQRCNLFYFVLMGQCMEQRDYISFPGMNQHPEF